MRRRALAILSLLSLLLCLASLAMWFRSHRVGEAWVFEPADLPAPAGSPPRWASGLRFYSYRWIASAGGRFQIIEKLLMTSRNDTSRQTRLGYQRNSVGWLQDRAYLRDNDPSEKYWVLPGVEIGWRPIVFTNNSMRVGYRNLIIAWRVPTLFFAILPALWVWRRWCAHVRLRKRQRLNLCPTCGYDLRATPSRCPECGTPASVEAKR